MVETVFRHFYAMKGSIMRLVFFLMFLTIQGFCADQINILIKMMPEQEKYFKEKILKEFEEKNNCKINVYTFADNWELKDKLSSWDVNVDVVKVPMGMARPLVVDKLISPLADVLSSEKMNQVKEDYFLLKLATFMGKVYYVPRKFDTRIMVYMKSKVNDAVTHWQSMEKEIKSAVKKLFNADIPQSYKLSADPNDWSYLDLFVAGYFWTHTPYAGGTFGRIAHRGKEYSGTAIGLMDKCFQMGARTQDVLNTQSDFFTEVLFWESLYAGHSVYNAESWTRGWDGKDIWKAMGEGKVFLSFLTQIDCYFLHGAGGAQGYLDNPDDLGYAVMPMAVPSDGKSAGYRSISTGGWLWGISSKSAKPDKAFDLISFITNQKNQIDECGKFGMIPVRKDILKVSKPSLDAEWKIDVFNTSVKQLRLNGDKYLPHLGKFEETEKVYIKNWRDVMEASKSGPISKTKIKFIQMGN